MNDTFSCPGRAPANPDAPGGTSRIDGGDAHLHFEARIVATRDGLVESFRIIGVRLARGRRPCVARDASGIETVLLGAVVEGRIELHADGTSTVTLTTGPAA